MIVIGALLLGVFLGVRTAKKQGGSRLDMAQYGAVYAIALGLLGLIATIAISRYIV